MISNDIAKNQEITRLKSQVATLEQLLEVYEQTTLEQSDKLEQALQALTKRATELETAARVSAAAATILEPVKLLQVVTDLTKSSFNLYHAHIYLLNEAGDMLRLVAGAGKVGRQMVTQGWSIPLTREQSLVARVARTQQGVIVNNVQEAPDWLPNPLLPNTRSELAIPLIVGDRLLGVLDVQSDELGHFTGEDVRIQTTLAAQIAVALQNAKSFEQSRVALAETRMLYDISARLNTAQSLEEMLEAAISPGILAGASSAGIWLFDSDAAGQPEWMEFTATWVHKGEPLMPLGTRLRLVDFPSYKVWINTSGQPTFISNIEHDEQVDPHLRTTFTQVGVQAVAFMPLTIGGRWVGLTIVSWQTPHAFSASEQQLYQSIAVQTAVAIENRHLFAQTQAALAEVQQSQRLLRSAIDATPDWIIIKDRDHRFRLVNQSFASSVHLTPEALIGKTDLDLGIPEDMVKGNPEKGIRGFWADDLEVMNSDQLKFIPEEPIITDGQLRFLSTTKVPLRDANGDVEGLLVFVHDITERKRIEEVLRQSEVRYRTLAQNLPIGLYRNTPGPQGKFLMVNEAMAQIFGYDSPEELLQLSPIDLYPDPAQRKVFSDKLLAQGKVINEEMEFKRKDGTRLWVALTATAIQDETGQVAYFDGTIEDITERKRVEETLRENEARLSEALKIARMSTWGLDLKSQMISLSPEHQVIMGLEVTHSSGLTMPLKKYTQEYVVAEDIPLFDERVGYAIDSISHPDDEDRLGQGKFEYRLKCLDGQMRYMAVFSRRRMDTPWVILGITQDITEQKQAELERERLLAEVEGAYRQYVHREWEQFLGEQPQSQVRVEHQQKTAGSLSDEALTKMQAEVAREGKAKVTARHNGDPTQPAIVAPIALRGQVIGTLSLQDIDPDRHWTAEERALVETVSEQLALTVENLRLFDDTQKRAMREQMTRQITDKMHAAPDIDSIVQTGLNELAKALNVSRAYVKLTTKPEDK